MMDDKRLIAKNKRLSRQYKKRAAYKTKLKDLRMLIAGWLYSFLKKCRAQYIPTKQLSTSGQDITINLTGTLDLGGDMSFYQRDLESINEILQRADVTFTSSKYGNRSTENYQALQVQLQKHKVFDVAADNDFIRAVMYETQLGNIAVIHCRVHKNYREKGQLQMKLLAQYHILRRRGAKFVLVWVDSDEQRFTQNGAKHLYNRLLKAGVDYIVGVRPANLDSGIAFRQKDGTVTRALYSTGTFLSSRSSFPVSRAIIRIKLREVNGKVQTFEEGYYPLRYMPETGFKDLLENDILNDKNGLLSLTTVEQNLPRLRRVDRILTVGKIMEIIGAELPEKIRYLQDFSVGKISSYVVGRQPGDVFFRWEPYTCINDADTYKERYKRAIAHTKRLSKVVLLTVTFKDMTVNTPCVVVDNVQEAHIAVCKYLREQLPVRSIAITGSIGKTSTKDMLTEVMQTHFNTVSSQKNENTHTRISLNVQKITDDCQVYIQEIGGGRVGGASRHSRMISPEAAIVTNIGDAHLGNFYGDKESLARNKLEIVDGLPSDGVLYLNGDDPLLVKARPNCKTVLYAVHNHDADYYAKDIRTCDTQTYFTIVYGSSQVDVQLNVPGEHNVLNAVCAFAVAKQFGVPDDKIVEGILNFKTKGIRQNIVSACGMKLFLDCYNASSGSVESSIKTLVQIPVEANGKKIALIGDITGLGEDAESTHKQIAQPLIENPADVYIFYGKDNYHTYKIVCDKGIESYYTGTHKEVCRLLSEIAKPGDIIMAKGSSKMKLEYVLDCVYGTRFFDAVQIDDNGYFRVNIDGIAYNLFSTHATAVKSVNKSTNLRVKAKVGRMTVYNIASSFAANNLEYLELPETIRHIGMSAFRDCVKLKCVEGANNLQYIEISAFNGCASLEEMFLPDTLLHIGNMAFMGCTALKELYVPESVVQIGSKAFADCPNLKLLCKAGSYAEQYFRENDLEYTCV